MLRSTRQNTKWRGWRRDEVDSKLRADSCWARRACEASRRNGFHIGVPLSLGRPIKQTLTETVIGDRLAISCSIARHQLASTFRHITPIETISDKEWQNHRTKLFCLLIKSVTFYPTIRSIGEILCLLFVFPFVCTVTDFSAGALPIVVKFTWRFGHISDRFSRIWGG